MAIHHRRLQRFRPLIIGGALVVGALEALALRRSRRQRRRAEAPPRAISDAA